MGNIPVTLTVSAPSQKKDAAHRAMSAAFEEARRLESLLSEYQPNSDISRINRAPGSWTSVSFETIEVLTSALHAFENTQGLFDITFKSRDPRITSRAVIMDENRVRLTSRRAQIGVSGIAKGYIVDAMARVLHQAGFTRYLVDAGDIYARGKWKVSIKNPLASVPLCRITVKNQAISSSGLYERGPHIIDPRTGKPATDESLVQATVIAQKSVTADSFDNAAFLMDERSHATLAKNPDVEALLILTRRGLKSYGKLKTNCR